MDQAVELCTKVAEEVFCGLAANVPLAEAAEAAEVAANELTQELGEALESDNPTQVLAAKLTTLKIKEALNGE
jgi:hypothetical protein